MKINHKLIRQTIQIIGVSIFLMSIFFKLKAIILMGGTKSISDELEPSDEEVDFGEEDESYDEPAVTQAEAPSGF